MVINADFFSGLYAGFTIVGMLTLSFILGLVIAKRKL